MISLRTAQKKHAEFFYAISSKAGRRHKSQASSVTSLSMMDTEWRNIVLAAEALPVLQRSLELFATNNDLQGRIRVLNNMTSANIALGEPNNAIQQLVVALQEADRLGAKREVAHLLGNLGIIFAGLQRLDEAIMLLRESLDISLQIGEHHLAKFTQQNLSILLNRKKQVGS